MSKLLSFIKKIWSMITCEYSLDDFEPQDMWGCVMKCPKCGAIMIREDN